MNLYCTKCSKFTNKNYNIIIKCDIERKMNLYFHCIDCCFKKIETIDKEELSNLLKNLNYIQHNVTALFAVCSKAKCAVCDSKNQNL